MKTRLLSVLALALFTAMVLFAASGKSQVLGPGGPKAYFTYSPTAPMPSDVMVFDASSSYDPSGNIVIYTWDFGDGTVQASVSPSITHSYFLDGTYTVQLTVTDNHGATDSSSAVVDVSTVTFFRVVIAGTLTPLSNVKVTAYSRVLGSWVAIQPSEDTIEVKYDNMTQPNLATTSTERYRNPGYTASVLRNDASNIGFDIHPTWWDVFFKFEWGSYVAYWPNETSRVYSYDNGAVESYDYLPGHMAEWDSSASTYVIHANDIPGHGVAPTQSHPIIVSLLCPPPPIQYYLTVNTAPAGLSTIPGHGWYSKGTNVVLTAPAYANVTSGSRYRFNYWDLDGVSQGIGTNPITVGMLANHTATARYVLQYGVTFNQNGVGPDATGTIVTVNASAKTLSDLPFTYWVDYGNSVVYAYGSPVASSVTGKQYRLNSVGGPSSPIVVSGSATVCGNYVAQYSIIFAQTGLDATATGTVATLNGTGKTSAQMPFTWWVDAGSMITYHYNSIMTSSVADKQFRLTGVTLPASPFSVAGPVNVTGSYCIQFKVNLVQTGLDSTATGTVVTVNGNPNAYTNLPYAGWFEAGTTITYSYSDPILSSTTGKEFRRTGISGPNSPFAVVGPTTVTGNYKTQFRITFDQTGVGTDFTGTVLTIDSVNYNVASMPVAFWWDQSSSHNFSFSSPLIADANKQYVWNSTSGLTSLHSGMLSVATSGSIIGNYGSANAVTFDQIGIGSDYMGTVVEVDGTPYGITALPISFAWQTGSIHNFTFHSPLVVSTNVEQYVWTSTIGLSTIQSGSITITAFGNIIGNYKTQYYLMLITNPPAIASPSGAGWYDAGTYASVSTAITIDIVPNTSHYEFLNWTTGNINEIANSTAPATTVMMYEGKRLTANYVTQFKIIFDESAASAFSGSIVNVDGTEYQAVGLSTSFWWNSGSMHSFAFHSPLVVNASLQYAWTSTSGLTALQSGTLTVSSSGSVTGVYAPLNSYQITFDQIGVNTDFNGTIVTIDGVNYDATQLPVSFWCTSGSSHAFSYSSPLLVSSEKRYAWTSTSGLMTSQSGSLTTSSSGGITGNYKTQYYLTLDSNLPGVDPPPGTGWYDADSNVTISTPGYVDIIPGSSRYRFNGWTTTNMSKIADPSRTPTTTIVNEDPTITANYVVQYFVTINQTGVGSDFTGTIATIDTIDFNGTSLPITFAWDNGTTHTFELKSPLVVVPSAKRYVWTGTTGLSTTQSDTITATTFGTIVGSYQTQYYVTVGTNPPGIAPILGEGWYNQSAVVTLTAPAVPNYTFDRWYINGAPQGAGINPITITMNAAYSTQAYYNPTAPYVLTITTTLGGTTNPSPGAYNYASGQNVQVTAIPSSGYVLDHWEYDGTNISATNNPYAAIMNTNHSLKAVFLPAPPPPTVSISPMTTSINLGQSLQFTSTVTGGKSPYQYQWYFDGAPVSGATASNWMFTPTASSLHFVHLKVTDALNNTVYSTDASVTVIGNPPIGGYSVSLSKQRITIGIAAYSILLGMLSIVLVFTKRKRK